MPQVQMRCKAGEVPENLKAMLPTIIAGVVAEALHVEAEWEAHLTSDDVEVVVTESGPYDVNVVPLSLVILAHNYPKRLATINLRATQIAEGLRGLLDQQGHQKITGCVWLPLSQVYVTF